MKRLQLVPPIEDSPEQSSPPEEWVVKAEGLGKLFDIYLNDRNRVYEFFGNRKHHMEHWALRDLNFEVKRGHSFGIIGPNGAGKSTLLKLIAGITRPTTGRLLIRAHLSTLLDLGLGFHHNFSGRENIRMNCALLGMEPGDVESAIPEIISFAELGDFIDYPVRTYSAGMNLRLGFSIAAHVPSDVLLVDEVLTVGDQYFQRRCVKKIEEFLKEGRTIILVSHDLHSVRSLCDEALWIEEGEMRAFGPAQEVVDRYLDIERSRASDGRPIAGPFIGSTHRPSLALPQKYMDTAEDPKLKTAVLSACQLEDPRSHFSPMETEAYDVVDGEAAVVQGSGEIRIIEVKIVDGSGHPRGRFRTGEDLVTAVTFRTTEPVEEPIFGIALFRGDGVYVHGPNTRFDKVLEGTYNGVYTFFIRWRKIPLLTGTYRLSIAVFDKNHLKPHIWHNQLYDFEIISEVADHGLVMMEHDWGLVTHLEE
jgi:ABC-type polysaccharide/polyol phosphate transport system ATPase subunit